MKNDEVSMWFYDKNGTRVAKEQVSMDGVFNHLGFLALDGVTYKTTYNRLPGGYYYCNEIVPLVVQEVVEGL